MVMLLVIINDNTLDVQAVGTNSGVGEVVAESHQELLLLVPQIKSNVSEALELVPEVRIVCSSTCRAKHEGAYFSAVDYSIKHPIAVNVEVKKFGN